MTEQVSAFDRTVIDLLASVRAAKEAEITERARISLERERQLGNLATYSSILAQEAQRFGARLVRLSQPCGLARFRRGTPPHLSEAAVSFVIADRGVRLPKKFAITKSRLLQTPLLFVNQAENIQDVEAGDIEPGEYVHGWRFGARVSSKSDGKAVHAVTIEDKVREQTTGYEITQRQYYVAIEHEGVVPLANLYVHEPPRGGPFPAQDRQDLPDETYLLPIGLIRAANQLPNRDLMPDRR